MAAGLPPTFAYHCLQLVAAGDVGKPSFGNLTSPDPLTEKPMTYVFTFLLSAAVLDMSSVIFAALLNGH